jgi:N-acetylmuramic acid 6-phosphate etherase
MAAAACIGSALPHIEAAACDAAARLRIGGRLAYAGAGTSARVAAQDAAELWPTFGWPAARVVVLIAGGAAALAASVEGAEDNMDAGCAEIDHHAIGAGDVLLAIAASGATKFTVGCVRRARSRGCLTIGISSVSGSALAEAAEHAVITHTGAEPIAGSTRLKAGIAHKIVLNLFSTLLMIRLGHVHDAMMVDLRPSNEKLQRRACAMVQSIAGCDAQAAHAALVQAGNNVKRAVLLARGVPPDRLESLLAEASGSLRTALALIGP